MLTNSTQVQFLNVAQGTGDQLTAPVSTPEKRESFDALFSQLSPSGRDGRAPVPGGGRALHENRDTQEETRKGSLGDDLAEELSNDADRTAISPDTAIRASSESGFASGAGVVGSPKKSTDDATPSPDVVWHSDAMRESGGQKPIPATTETIVVEPRTIAPLPAPRSNYSELDMPQEPDHQIFSKTMGGAIVRTEGNTPEMTQTTDLSHQPAQGTPLASSDSEFADTIANKTTPERKEPQNLADNAGPILAEKLVDTQGEQPPAPMSHKIGNVLAKQSEAVTGLDRVSDRKEVAPVRFTASPVASSLYSLLNPSVLPSGRIPESKSGGASAALPIASGSPFGRTSTNVMPPPPGESNALFRQQAGANLRGTGTSARMRVLNQPGAVNAVAGGPRGDSKQIPVPPEHEARTVAETVRVVAEAEIPAPSAANKTAVETNAGMGLDTAHRANSGDRARNKIRQPDPRSLKGQIASGTGRIVQYGDAVPYGSRLPMPALFSAGGTIPDPEVMPAFFPEETAQLIEALEGQTGPLQRLEVGVQGPELALPVRMTARPEMTRQMADVLVRNPGSPVEIALDPEELGRVHMVMSTSETGVTLAITTERVETQDLMRRHIDQLANELRRLGYDNISFEFSSHGRGGSDQSDRRAPSTPALEPTQPETETAQPGQQVASSGLDLRL